MDRYHRQVLLPFIGPAGQARFAASRVLLVGCGALGGTVADQLVRAGVGHLRLVDRDVVELTNLQRQVLFDEADARDGAPKAAAAAKRLRAVNSGVTIEPVAADVHAGNVERLMDGVDVTVDGTDNAETRYLVNDASVKHGRPWVYGGCVGAEGRVMTVRPGGPCLRCVFPTPPAAGELPTCDTAGVLGPAAAVVAALQAAAVLRLLVGAEPIDALLSIDIWAGRFRSVAVGPADSDCPCCGRRRFDFLDRPVESTVASLCGRNTVQVRPVRATTVAMETVAARLSAAGEVQRSAFLLRFTPADEGGVVMSVFPDGRTLVAGTTDVARARSLVSRYVGG